MSRRGLNIYHRKDGRYEGRYANGYRADGKVKYHSVYGKSYTEVKEKLLKIRAKITVPKAECRLTVKELFAEWLSVKQTQVKISTYSNYVFKVKKHLIPAFGNLKMSALTSERIYKFIHEKQQEGLSDKYISDIIVVLKNMAKYTAKRHNFTNFISDIELPKIKKYEPEIYNKEEQKRLESILLKNMNTIKMAVFLTLYTGIRIGELCGLKWSDIDFNAKTLRIERTVQRVKNDDILWKTK